MDLGSLRELDCGGGFLDSQNTGWFLKSEWKSI
jgi:hypothetical protein